MSKAVETDWRVISNSVTTPHFFIIMNELSGSRAESGRPGIRVTVNVESIFKTFGVCSAGPWNTCSKFALVKISSSSSDLPSFCRRPNSFAESIIRSRRFAFCWASSAL